MNFLASLIAKILEYFLGLFVKFLSDKWRQKKQIDQDEKNAHDNTEKIEQAKSHEEKVKADRKSTRLNSSHIPLSRMPSSA